MKKRLVLFDFDGTITTKDTFLEFIRFYFGSKKFVTGFALQTPWIGLMMLKAIPNWKAKERVLTWFFSGESIQKFDQKGREFCEQIVPKLVRPGALSAIEEHRRAGATIVVISASAENWVRPWCDEAGLECLATQLEVVDGKLTGRIEGLNCYGPEKENRIRACYNIEEYDEVVAYGDSRGDLEMLALANQQYYRPFRD